jgi:hypothetical protein
MAVSCRLQAAPANWGRVSDPTAALSGSPLKASGTAGGYLLDQSLPSPFGTRPVGRVGAGRGRLPSLGVFQQPRLLLWCKASDLRL